MLMKLLRAVSGGSPSAVSWRLEEGADLPGVVTAEPTAAHEHLRPEGPSGDGLPGRPCDPESLCLVAAVFADRGNMAQAGMLADQAVVLGHSAFDILCAAAEIHRRTGRYRRALELAERACTVEPKNACAWILRGVAQEALGRHPDAFESFSRAIEIDPSNRDIHSTLLYMLLRTDVLPIDEVVAEHRRWAVRHCDSLGAGVPPHANIPDPQKRLRVGYLSADFRQHVVAHFIEPVVAAHDRNEVEVFCFSACRDPDARSERIKVICDHWIDISSLADEAAARAIRDERIDILVDLSGHTWGNRLPVLARKPAPVQTSWLGYLGTTGMAAIDYCITDAYADPPGESDRHYTESLVRLPVCQWCYLPPEQASAVSRLPASRLGYVTFASLARFDRLSEQTLRAWARILRDVPGSRLRIMDAPPGESLDRMFEVMEGQGVFAHRIDLTGRMEFGDYLSALGEVDIALGAFPYSGATTTCEALWMGVPMVCRRGEIRAARSSASILDSLGFSGWIAGDWDAYCTIAVKLATDIESLGATRAILRDRMRASTLTDAPRFTRYLEQAYRGIWAAWCARATRSTAPDRG